jgi:Cu/Ag efflux protein CusF
MTFQVAPNVDLEALAPGTEVDFRLSDAGDGLTVVEIRPVAP